MRILFLSNWFPYPPINGAKIRIFNLIRELAADHEISLVAFARTFSIDEVERQLPVLSCYAKTIKVIPAKKYDGQTASKRGWLSFLPRSVVQTYSEEMEDFVLSEASSGQYDLVVASEAGPPSGVSLLASRVKGIPVILDEIEVAVIKEEYEGEKNLLKRLRRGLAWMKSSRLTRETICRVAAATVPSMQEFEYIRGIVGDEAVLEVIPHGVGMELLERPLETPQPNEIVFTGAFTYGPNADAVIHFLDEIYPRLKELVPGISLTVLGSSNGVDLTRFEADKSVRFAGFVPDVSEYVARSWLSIVPLRIGAGTRLKIVESMALGTPVVSTSKGAEGLAVTDGENILIADDPESFAKAIAKVIDDAELRLRLSENGRRLVSAKYSARAMGRSFSTLIEQVCAARIASGSRYAHSTKATGVDSRAPFRSDGL